MLPHLHVDSQRKSAHTLYLTAEGCLNLGVRTMLELYNVQADTQIVVLDVLSGDRLITTAGAIVRDNPFEAFQTRFLTAMERNEHFIYGGGAQPLFEMHRLLH